MMMNSDILIARNFEIDVIDFITSMLSESETIELEPLIGNERRNRADAVLKQGCKKLKINSGTLVEIKYRLETNLALRVIQRYTTAMNRSQKYKNLIIICNEKYFDYDEENQIHGLKIQILTFKELQGKFQDKEKDEVIDKSKIKRVTNIEKAKDTFASNNITLFLGAGVSIDAKLPNWSKLLERLLVQDNETPFKYINEANSEAISDSLAKSDIVTGRYIIEGYKKAIKAKNKNLTEQEINKETNERVINRIRNVLYNNVGNNISELINAVAKTAAECHVKQIITYNYDDLIETELKTITNASFVPIYDESIELSVNDKPIYHVHGFIPREKDNPSVPVLSEKEYHKLYSRMHHWANVVQLNALYTTTCFFIGFSMTDPNQRRLLDLARNVDLDSIDSDEAQHFVLLHRERLKGEAVKEVNNEHYQEIEDMMFELGLNVIWFDNFNDLPKILLYIAGLNKEKP